MKKFVKAIAFITVMCLALSTVAFAEAEVTDYTAKKVTITVKDVQKGEQVAIIITKGDTTEFTTETILFIDQKAAESNTAVFEAEITDTSVKNIDIYAGYDSNSSQTAVQVGTDIPISLETKLTLVAAQVIDDVTKQENYDEEAMKKVDEGTKGSVVYLKINLTNVAIGDLTKMYWAFHVTNNETGIADTKYSVGDAKSLGLGTVVTGDVELAAAFESTGYTVNAANAIFQIRGEDVHTAEDERLEEIKGDKVEK